MAQLLFGARRRIALPAKANTFRYLHTTNDPLEAATGDHPLGILTASSADGKSPRFTCWRVIGLPMLMPKQTVNVCWA